MIREQYDVKVDIMTKIEKTKWFGNVERVDEGKFTKQIYVRSVNGCVGRGRSKRTFRIQIGDVW